MVVSLTQSHGAAWRRGIAALEHAKPISRRGLQIRGLTGCPDADAYFGLDDLREWCIRQGTTIPVYLDRPTYEAVAKSFPYLVDRSQASGGGDM